MKLPLGYRFSSVYAGIRRIENDNPKDDLGLIASGAPASFIEAQALEGFTVRNDIVYAQPGVKKLKYDVFSPNGAKDLHC